MNKILLILLGLPVLLWSQDKGEWGEKGIFVPIVFFTPFILIYFFFPKIHKLARNIYLTFTLVFIILLCIIFIKTMFSEGKQNQPSSSTITEQKSVADTSNWTVYTNKTYGYALKFPTTYQVTPQTEREKILQADHQTLGVQKMSDPSSSSAIIIKVMIEKNNLSIEDYMNKFLKSFEITGPLVKFNFNGYDSLSNKNQPGTDVFIKQGQYVYHITAPTASLDKEVEDILATFKFTQ